MIPFDEDVLMRSTVAAFFLTCLSVLALQSPADADAVKDTGLQFAENPPMRTVHRAAPQPEPNPENFEVRPGFRVIDSLDAFRRIVKQDDQKIRMKPGVYRAEKVDPPMPEKNQQHIFAVNGSGNHFDLRGVVIETPVSVQSQLTNKAHVADSWHINGHDNTFEGGYFRNVVDRPYGKYNVTENEFEVPGDRNVFINCTFVIKGSVPYGYSDFYGKGSSRWGRLDKHSFMSISGSGTELIGCAVYQQSYGHGVHFHGADGALIKDCYLTGTLRPTNDIYKEKVGRAKQFDFNIMYRGQRPIPRDQMIPLTEDGIRTYGGDKNIQVINTTVERFRCGAQIHAEGHIVLRNVTVREAGYFGFDVSAGPSGRVTMQNCRADVAYSPLFNLTRGALPHNSVYEVTVLPPRPGVEVTEGTNLGRPTDLGRLCGRNTTFIFHKGGEQPLPEKILRIRLGDGKPLVDSKVINNTPARIVLSNKVRNCTIKSLSPVEDHGQNNTIIQLDPDN